MNGTLLTMDQAYSKYLKALLWMFLATIGGMALGNVMPGIYLIAAIASLVLCIVMAFSKGTTKFVTTMLFSVTMGVTLEATLSMYQMDSIMLALGITLADVMICAYLALRPGANFLGLGKILFFSLIGVIIYEIVGIFLSLPAVHGIVIAIFTCYMLYDINKTKLLIDEYGDNVPSDLVLHQAAQLYLDIINVFLRILRLLGKSRD